MAEGFPQFVGSGLNDRIVGDLGDRPLQAFRRHRDLGRFLRRPIEFLLQQAGAILPDRPPKSGESVASPVAHDAVDRVITIFSLVSFQRSRLRAQGDMCARPPPDRRRESHLDNSLEKYTIGKRSRAERCPDVAWPPGNREG